MANKDRIDPAFTEESRYRLLVESITDYAIYMLDADGIVSSWNPGAQRFKGYSSDEIIGKHFSRFYSAEDREAGVPQRALETALTKGKFEAEGWRIRKDGSRFWAYVIIDPIRTPEGELVGFAKITRDLTERRQSEETLRQSQEQFRLLVQGVTDYALYMLNPKGEISSWNVGAQRIKGYEADEVIGSHVSRFYTEEDRTAGEPAHALETAIREGRFEKEGQRVRKDGSKFWAHVVIDAIRDEAGQLVGFAKITRDVTEQREARRALEHAREALFQSQKVEALGQLTGGVAHDFNNLLMAVLGSLELVQPRLPPDPKISALIENAVRGARRGVTLTQRMLSFARRQDLKIEAVNVPALVQGMGDLLGQSLSHDISVETRFPLSLPEVQADSNQVELALLNLVINARDAMPAGGPIIVAARAETLPDKVPAGLQPGRYVCLSVTDVGHGMDEETLARAVDPFFTTKGVGKGTGLGLAMVHGMAEQSGGRLALRSKKGDGTTAEIWLPVALPSTPGKGARPDEAAITELAPDPAESHPLKILAVDDDNLVLLNTLAMLEALGHTPLEANSGQEALQILRNDHIDLLITDQLMPQMTGIELVAAARAEQPDLPVILASGYADLPPGSTVGISRLNKPFGQAQLKACINLATDYGRRIKAGG